MKKYLFVNHFAKPILGKLAPNVQGIRRFCGCNKGMRSIPATVKMWWSKTPQRAQARLVFCGTRAANGGEAHTVLLCVVAPYSIISIYYLFIKCF
jgi:hypothetical protein